MIKVIVINGMGTSGKDTFIDLFAEVCKERGNYSVFRFSSVDKVKEYAYLMGWDGMKDNKGRRFLSDIKDALTLYSDAPYRYMEEQVNDIKDSFTKDTNAFVFFHVREPIEIKKMVDRLNATTLFIGRPSIVSDSFTNHADKDVEDYPYDYFVLNDGTLLDLKEKAVIFLDYLIKNGGDL